MSGQMTIEDYLIDIQPVERLMSSGPKNKSNLVTEKKEGYCEYMRSHPDELAELNEWYRKEYPNER